MSAVQPLSFQQSAIASGQAPLPPGLPKKEGKPPVQYESALKALEECQQLDDSFAFESLADALAAWAKVYADDRVAVEARRLKLHAYRRIGILAEKLAKHEGRLASNGAPITGRSVLIARGFTESKTLTVRRISTMPQQAFDQVVRQKKPPGPATLAHLKLVKGPEWRALSHRISSMLSKMRTTNVRVLAKKMRTADKERAAAQAREAIDWLQQLLKAVEK